MKKILLIFGTRPDAIKMCPLVNELKTRPGIRTVVCVTGQHRELLDCVLDTFGVVPDYDLAVMRHGQTLFDITSDILLKIRGVLEETSPDIALVHGDTTTAFAASLACFYMRIPVGHVEAGLRTHDLYSPFPEEFNRAAAGLISRWHFAPTERARANLLAEGKAPEGIFVTGNTEIDALATTVRDNFSHELLDFAAGKRLILITAHRRENLGEPMRGMFRAIRRIIEEFPDTAAVYSVHPNPAVSAIAREVLSDCSRIKLADPPPGPIDFHNIMARSYVVLTDSGGVQEDAPSLGKPVLVMRDTTERPEGIEAGTLKLVGTDEGVIYTELKRLLTDGTEYARMSSAPNPYGDGQACRRIADILCRFAPEIAAQPQ